MLIRRRHRPGDRFPPRRPCPSGFSLIEIMVGFSIFSVVALGLATTAMFSMRMSHVNVMKTTAYASAQGFLEQIKVMPDDEILAALDDPSGHPLPTRSISISDQSGSVDIENPLFLEDPNATAAGQNLKQIVVDLKETASGTREVTMDIYYDLDITELALANGYLVELSFNFEITGMPAGPAKQKGHLSMVRTTAWGQSTE